MALVPRHVRVTSVALYNFIITNISGLSTTLVPLLRAHYDSPRVFRFYAAPLAGAAATAAANAVSSSDPASGLRSLSSVMGLEAAMADGGGKAGNAVVEFSVSEPGSRGMQAAMLWMYPGMFLASSGAG